MNLCHTWTIDFDHVVPGQKLHELPPGYRSWLISKEIYADKADLKAALIKSNYLTNDVKNEPASQSPPRKRKLSDAEPAVPPSSAKKLAISKEARRNGTMLNYDGEAYILDFGKYAGKKLTDVPRTYTDWLVATNVYEQRPDLAAALREGGFMVENFEPGDLFDPTWRAPKVHDATFADMRFFDNATESPLWISDVDTSRYFRLGEPLLSQSGVRLLSAEDVKRSTPYQELVTVPKGKVRWLHQVYACAGFYGSCGPCKSGGSGAVELALRAFLGKNRVREREIWDEMGLP